MTSVPILIGGTAGATGSVATGGLTGAGASALLCFRIDLCRAADFCCARATLRSSVAPAQHQKEVRRRARRMRWLDPMPTDCPACGGQFPVPVAELRSLRAACPGCGGSLAATGERMIAEEARIGGEVDL